jgi:hypothetical protein
MHLLYLLAAVACVPGVHSSPAMKLSGILARANSDRGNETVAGLGSRKEEVVNAGGNTRDLAIAMLETSVSSSYFLPKQIAVHTYWLQDNDDN